MAIDRNSDIHDAAAVGFSRAADAYVRGRPEYSDEAVRYVANRLYLFGSALHVVDLAAGTGKFTKILDALSPSLVSSITAVEPVEAMRVKGESVAPRTIFIAGTAENIPLANDSCDVATVAQAFHWFDGTRAIKEIHRVLRPGGMLLMIWNVRDERQPWVREMTELMVPYEAGAPRYRSMNWRKVFDEDASRSNLEGGSLFTSLELTKFSHVTTGSMETMLDRVASVSFVASLAKSDQAVLLSKMRELYRREIKSGELAMPYETHIFTCFKI